MEGWKELVLKLPGLPMGKTTINTEITSDFFKAFDSSPIQAGIFDTTVVVDKKPDLYVVHIDANGWHAAQCDRCLEPIQLPSKAQYVYYFKKEASEDWANEDVIMLEDGEVELDIRPYVHETIVLSLPMVSIYDCENDDNAPCDERILEILSDEEKDSEKENPTWDILKNIKFED